MNRIDTSEWKDFEVGRLFDIHPTKAYKMTNAVLMDGGDNAVVVNSSYNNGIGGYTSQAVTENGNRITFSDTTTSDAVFYQPNPFVGYPHIQGLYPIGEYKDSWTAERLMFFAVVFKKSAVLMGFDYAYKFTRDIASNMVVPLPVDSSGQPDWAYMDSFMRNIMDASEACLGNLRLAKPEKTVINYREWKRFSLFDDALFDIDMGTKLDKAKMTMLNPTINFVGRANQNNGITGCVDEISGVTPYEAGTMSLSLGGEYLGSCFIQPAKFYVSQNVVVLKPKWAMPFNVKMFISVLIFRESRQYYKAFVDELNRHIKTDFSVLLPVDNTGVPDWVYMDSFMRNIMDASEACLGSLRLALAN